MPVINLPWGDLADRYLAVQVRCGEILQDMDAIPLVHPVKVVPPSAYGAG